MRVLGIDAGGTKTLCVLADERGTILAEARGAGANLHTAGPAAVEQVLHALIARVLGAGGLRPDAVCVGMAGVDRDDEKRDVAAIVSRAAPGSRVLVVNDAQIALAAGARDQPGVVMIAGTGSIVYGRNGRGGTARAGGWGHMIGDEGSGYWIGREALSAVMRHYDGRGPATDLMTGVLRHFEVPDISQLPRIVYDREQPRISVAALGPIVEQAGLRGDTVASDILFRAAEELALAARSVVGALGMADDVFGFYLAGGVFRVIPSMWRRLPTLLRGVAPRATTERLDAEPALGAVWLALRHHPSAHAS
jgi:glucosamine kinase